MERGCGFLLTGQRAVKRDLEELGQLCIDGRDRPRDGVLDDASNLVGGAPSDASSAPS